MRLFGQVDSQVNRFDRAEWMSPPFDRSFVNPPVVTVIVPDPLRARSDRIGPDPFQAQSLRKA